MIARLLLKDFKVVQKNVLIVIFIYIIFMPFFLAFICITDTQMLGSILKSFTTALWFFIFFAVVLSSLIYENKREFVKVAISLPISRKKYILTKYISIFIASISAYIASLLINYLILYILNFFLSVQLNYYNIFFEERNLVYFTMIFLSIPIGTIIVFFLNIISMNKSKTTLLTFLSLYSIPIGFEYLEDKMLSNSIQEKLDNVIFYEATIHNFIYWIFYIFIFLIIIHLSNKYFTKRDI